MINLSSRKHKILVVAAHPDDEILGCGGTIARLSKEGHEVHILILGEGATSRDQSRNIAKRSAALKKLRLSAEKAAKVLGACRVHFHDFPDNRFDSVALLDIVKAVEQVKEKIRPSIILTHFAHDLNIDHQKTFKAVLTATRPMKNETVRAVYSFEILSSTEWQYAHPFPADTFMDISDFFARKLRALKEYAQMRGPDHPRSSRGVTLNAELWGLKTGTQYAEALQLVRQII